MNKSILLVSLLVVLIPGMVLSISAFVDFSYNPKLERTIVLNNLPSYAKIHDVLADSAQNVYVNYRDSSMISKHDAQGNVLFQITPDSVNDSFYLPEAMALDSQNNLYVGMDSSVWKFDEDGNLLSKWGSFCELFNKRYHDGEISPSCIDSDSNGPNEIGDGQFADIVGITVDSDDNVYVVDISNHRIQKFDGMGNFLEKFGDRGYGDGQLHEPTSVAFDSVGSYYVGTNDGRIQKFDGTGKFDEKLFDNKHSEKKRIIDKVMLDSDDSVYLIDSHNNSLEKITFDGKFKMIHKDSKNLHATISDEKFYVSGSNSRVQILK